MHIVRKTNQELVVLDSSVWISIGLLCVSAFVVYRLLHQGEQRGLVVVGLFLLFALLFWRREVVVFDAARQQAEWRRRRFLKVATGTVPFSEITGIGMETSSGKNNELCYRLTMLTPDGSVPMADTYAGNREKYENLRKEILGFLHLDTGEEKSMHATLPASGIADEASVRSLLQQGRRIDAIHLVRSTQKVSLTEATNLVARMIEDTIPGQAEVPQPRPHFRV